MARPSTQLERIAAGRAPVSPLHGLLFVLMTLIAAALVAGAAAGGAKWEALAFCTIWSLAAFAVWLNLVDRFLDFAVWLLVFTAPISLDVELWHRIGLDPIVEEWPSSPTLTVPDLLIWLLYATWALELLKRRATPTIRLGWIGLFAGLFLAGGVVSFFASRDWISSLVDWGRTFHYVLMFVYLAKKVRDPRLFEWLLISIALSCWIEVLVSTLQYGTKSSLGLKIFGEREAVKTFDTPEGAEARAGGLMGHPNNLALYFVLVAPIAMAKVMQIGSALRWRLFWLATLVLAELGLLLTFSRAGWLCSATCALMIFHAAQRRRGWPLLGSMVLPVLSGFVLFVLLFALWEPFRARLTAPDYGSTATRWQQFQTAIQVIKQRWWCGTGVGAYTDGAWKWNAGFGDARNVLFRVHNGSLLVTAEMGVLGSLGYHAWAWLVMRRGWRQLGTLEDEAQWSATLGCFWGLLGWFAKSMYNVHTPIADANLWYVAALMLAVPQCGPTPATAERER